MSSFEIYQLVKLPAKHPDTARTYTFDLAAVEGTNVSGDTGFLQGRTISSSAVTLGTGITEDSESNTTTTISVKVSAGTTNNDYAGSAEITLDSGEVEVIEFCIPVRDPGCN